jgi:hypothetical protein
MAEVTNRPSLTLQVDSVLIGFGANRHTYSMNMLASPGGMRAALILAITCNTQFHIHKPHTSVSFATHMLSLSPVSIHVGELGEVPELELYRRHLRRADKALIVFITDALAILEIDHRQRDPGRRFERGKHAVSEIPRSRQVERVASREVVSGKEATEYADRSLAKSMKRTRQNGERTPTSNVL